MKFYIVILGLLAILYGGYAIRNRPYVLINGQKMHVLVADTDALRIQGLSGKENLPSDTGMLFVFPEAEIRTFWNKDMRFPIDVYWIKDETIVGYGALPIDDGENVAISSPSEVIAVLEVVKDTTKIFNLQVGQTVEFINIAQAESQL